MSSLLLLALATAPTNQNVCPGGIRSATPFVSAVHQGLRLFRPAVVCSGEALVVAVDGCTDPSLDWNGDTYGTFEAAPGRRHALLPVPLDTPAGEQLLRVRCYPRQATFRIPIREGAYPESTLRVDPRFSKPPPPRAVTEQQAWDRAFAHTDPVRHWREAFLPPVNDAITSVFGVRRTFNDEVRSRHRGLDIDGREGTPILATNRGRVALVADNFYYVGNAVLIDHGWGLFSLYGHMSRVDVREGQMVERGQQIGAVGRTGRVTGPHVHFATKLNGAYIDPEILLSYIPQVP